MKKLIVITFSLLLAGTAAAKVNVVTTVQTFKSLTEEVGGDKVSVTALVGDDVDPHFVDPKPSLATVLNKADLLVHVGLELEKGWLPPLVAQARNPNIQVGRNGNLDASTSGIAIEGFTGPVTRAGGDIHPLGNPHYWLPPDNALKVARAIADRLKQLDAGNAGAYDKNYEAFAAKVAAKRKTWEQLAKTSLKDVKVVTYHKSWTYLTAWLGMAELGYIEPKPGIEANAQHLAMLIGSAKGQAKIVIVETYYPRKTAQTVASKAGMRLAVLPSDVSSRNPSYLQLMDHLLLQLVQLSQ
jgi:zinc/manganese transport system substrate-binding protein